MAALAMQRAVEHDSKEPKWLKERDHLLLLIPDQPATILQVKGVQCTLFSEIAHGPYSRSFVVCIVISRSRSVCWQCSEVWTVAKTDSSVGQEEGSRGLESWLAAEKERALPEFRRKRPKYYYYYEWMKERIATHCGALPEPVLDKLLNVEAGELDTLLTYPAGVQAKVSLQIWQQFACIWKPISTKAAGNCVDIILHANRVLDVVILGLFIYRLPNIEQCMECVCRCFQPAGLCCVNIAKRESNL